MPQGSARHLQFRALRTPSRTPSGAPRAPRALMGAALALGAVAAMALAPSSAAAAPATLTVVGTAKVAVEPDMAVLSAGTVSSAKTADEALADNSKAVTAVIAAIKEAGVAAKDIATANFSIQPQYAYAQQSAPRLTGFEVRNTVRVTVRDLSLLGGLLDKMVQSGANQASGLTFTLADPDKAEAEARAAAVKDAMAQAAGIAEAAGVKVTRITQMDVGADRSSPIMPAPMLMKAEAARVSVPVEGGMVEVRARASIVFEIEPK